MADKEYIGGDPTDSGGITQEEIYKFKDRVQQLEYAAVPVGSVVPYIGGTFTNGSNAGFSAIAGNASLAQVKTLVETQTNGKWTVCDGSLISNTDSPWDGLYVPNLTDDRFIEGYTSMGSAGGQTSINFCHRHSGTLPAHSHCMIHSHTVCSHRHGMAHNHAWAFKQGSWVSTLGQPREVIWTNRCISNTKYCAFSGGIHITNLTPEFPGPEDYNIIIRDNSGCNHGLLGNAVTGGLREDASYNTDGPWYTAGVAWASNGATGQGTGAVTSAESPSTGNSCANTRNSSDVGFNTGYTQGNTDIRPKYLTSFYLIRIA